MRRRRATILVILLAALWPDLTSAQCRKQIVLYLDVSGSMDPAGTSSESPYQQTLAAVGELLNTPDFIGAQDRLEVVPFGNTLYPPISAGGPEAIRSRLNELRQGRKPDKLSDFTEVLGDLVTKDLSAAIDRQVAIIASDFVHESEAHGEAFAQNAPPLPTWIQRSREEFQQALDRQHQDLRQLFASVDEAMESENTIKRNRLVLFSAPVTSQYRPLEGYRSDLRSQLQDVTGASNYLVGSGSLSKQLAAAIRRGFFGELVVSSSPDASGFNIEVRNPNCDPVEVDSFRASCFENGTFRDSFPVSEVELPLPIGPVSSTNVRIPSETFQERCGDTDYRIEVGVSDLGINGQVTASRRTRIDHYRGEVASKEWYLRGSTLRVFVEMTGQVVGPPEQFHMFVQRPGSHLGIVDGDFQAPSSLNATPRSYLFYFPSVDREKLRDLDELEIVIAQGTGGGRVLGDPSEVDVKGPDPEKLEKMLYLVLTVLSVVVLLGLFIVQRADGRTFGLVGIIIAILLSTGTNLFLSETIQLLWPDAGQLLGLSSILEMASVGLGFGILWYFGHQHYLRAKASEDVLPTALSASEITLAEIRQRLDRLGRRAGGRQNALVGAIAAFTLVLLISLGWRFVAQGSFTVPNYRELIVVDIHPE